MPFILTRSLSDYRIKKARPNRSGFFVEMREVESLTSCMPCKRSSQMSYTPIKDDSF